MWAKLKNLRDNYGAEVCFRRSVAAFPSWSPESSHRPAHVIFSVDQLALGKGFLAVALFGFPLSASFHQYSMLFFVFMLLISEKVG